MKTASTLRRYALPLVVGWIIGFLTPLLFTHVLDDASALGQLGQNSSRSMSDFYEKTGHYPKSLDELSIDTVHADGGNPVDLKHAVYLTEGPLAIIILQRPGVCYLVEFRHGSCTEVRFLGADPLQ